VSGAPAGYAASDEEEAMSEETGAVAGAGSPRRRHQDLPLPRRVASWLVWWVLLMALWVWFDDSLLTAELIAGAIVAALGAALVELVQYQTESHVRIRSEWLGRLVQLPWEVARDTFVVFAALAVKIVRGTDPPSGFEEIPTRYGDDSFEAATRRAFLVGTTSLAPNTFALGIDRTRDVMVVHRLVGSASGGRRRDDA
jgi:multisubunit Na+/H+ antiporter MnhE subunit